MSYSYPVGEQITEPSEAAQDPGKRDRECALIAAEASFDWKTALDFGCGRGANFSVIANAGTRADRRIIGLDLDPSRAAEAADAIGGLSVEVLQGGVDLVRSWPADVRFEFILLCQVIGHTPIDEADDILSALRDRLAPGGRMVALYPFAAGRAGDYLHLVDFAHEPNSEKFRRELTPSAFNAAARAPTTGLLPVRAFQAGEIAWRTGDTLPASAPTPATIGSHFRGFQLRSMIYSVHQSTDAGAAVIGDMATVVQAPS